MCAYAAARHGPELWTGLDVARRNTYCEARGGLVLPFARLPCSIHPLTPRTLLTQTVDWHAALRQRVNTVTNAPFLVTGIHILTLGVADARHGRRTSSLTSGAPPPGLRASELQRHWQFSVLFGLANMAVGIGSAFFHASWTRAGQRADMGGVYAVLLIPMCHVAHRLGLLGWGKWGHTAFLALSLALCAAAVHLKWRLHSSVVVPGLVAALAALMLTWLAIGAPMPPSGSGAAAARAFWCGPQPRQRPRDMAWPLAAACVLASACAFGATWVDMASPGACHPRGLWQWHSVWHVCSSAALWFLYAFLRSEAPMDRGADDEGVEHL